MKKIYISALALTILLTFTGCTIEKYKMGYQGLALPSTEEIAAINDNNLLTTPGGAYCRHVGGAIFANRELAEEKGLTCFRRPQEEMLINSEKEMQNIPKEIISVDDFKEHHCLSEKYFFIQSLYQKAAEEYFAQTLNLEKIDREIQKSNHNFQPLEEDQHYCQLHSMLNLDYIYLKNTAFIERLDQNDINLLVKYHEKNETEITDELRELVQRTYSYILAPVDTKLHPNITFFSYGHGASATFTINTIVFGISITNPYDNDGINLLIDDEKYQQDYLYLKEKLVPEVIQKLEGKLGKDTLFGFIVYDN